MLNHYEVIVDSWAMKSITVKNFKMCYHGEIIIQ